MANTTVYPYGTGGSLPSNIGIVNDLVTGGADKALSAEQGKVIGTALGPIQTAEIPISTTWAQGSINTSTGANANNTVTLRTGFLTVQYPGKLKISCATGYFIKAVCAYNTQDLNDYNGLVLYSYDGSSWDTTVNEATIDPNGKIMRVCVGRTDLGTITTNEKSNISIYDKTTALDKPIIVSIEDIEEDIEDINSVVVTSNKIQPNKSGYYIDSSGNESASAFYNLIRMLPVVEGDIYRYIGYCGSAGACAVGYDANGDFVSVLLAYGDYTDGGTNVTIPSGVAFASFCGRIDTYDFQVRRYAGTYTVQELERKNSDYLTGKRLYVIGDSIAQGIVSDGTAPLSPWPVIVADTLGMTLTNYGISASTIAVAAGNGGMYASLADLQAATKVTGMYYTVLTGNQTFQVYYWNGSTLSTSTRKLRTPIVQRYAFMADDADVVLVAGGTNDFQYNWTTVGTMADRTEDTFYGAMHLLCLGLLDKYIGKEIVFCTPIKRAQTNLDTNADTDAHKGGAYGTPESENLFGKTLGDYCEIIKEVCAYYSIPVIDMYSCSNLNPSIASQSSLFDSWKTHPLQEGHNMMARYIIGQLKAICG